MVPRAPLTYRILVGACFLVFITSCVSTYLDGPPIGTDYTRLAALGKRNLVVAVNTAAEEITVGHQWVFLVAPVGTIKLHNSHQVLSAALFRNLAERGYRPKILPPDGENGGSPDITITDLELACAVPDLFFVRRVNCSVVLHGFSGRAPSVPISGRGESSEFRTVGFKPQLEQGLEKALTLALDAFLNDMHF